MKIFRTVLLVAALMPIGSSIRAQSTPSADALQAARELTAIISKDAIRQIVTQVTAQVWPQIERSLKAKQDISTDQIADLRHEYERIQIEFISKIMEDAPAIYAKYFTAVELRELLAFYHTPTGAKAMRLMPQITTESVALILPRMQQLQMQVLKAFAKIVRSKGFNI